MACLLSRQQSNPLIKTKGDLLNFGVPVPGWQGSTQEKETTNFGRRQYSSSTGQFSSQDPVANGVSYNPFGNSGVVGTSHQNLARSNGQYSINNQNPLSNKEWDGYIFGGSISVQSLMDQVFGQNTSQVSSSTDSSQNMSSPKMISKAIVTPHLYVPSWRDYVGSSEKLFNDNLEVSLLLASFCNTDTLYPYNCNTYHSELANHYDTSTSPNVQGLSDYKRSHSYTYYTYETVLIVDPMSQLAITGSLDGKSQSNSCDSGGLSITLKCGITFLLNFTDYLRTSSILSNQKKVSENDISDYYMNLLNRMAKDGESNLISDLNYSVQIPFTNSYLVRPDVQINALMKFKDEVETGAQYDIKSKSPLLEINKRKAKAEFEGWTDPDPLAGSEKENDLWGNISYGYYGSANGFTDFQLKAGAGYAQVKRGTEGNITTYFDDPRDQKAIELGENLYQDCGNSCSKSDVQVVLNEYENWYINNK